MMKRRMNAGTEKGAPAVEFALLVPVMLILWCGVIEITQYVLVKRKVIAAVQSYGDLISQEIQVDDSELSDIRTAVDMILFPFPTENLTIQVSSISYNSSDEAEIEWQLPNTGADAFLDDIANLGSSGTGLIYVSAKYSYEAIFPTIFGGDKSLEEKSYLKPRRTSVISYQE